MNLALIPIFGYLGASWATVFTEIVLGVVGWTLTARHIGRVPVGRLGWRVVLAGLVMGVAVLPLRDMGGFAIAIPIVAAVLVYSVAALLLRAFTTDSIAWADRSLHLSPRARSSAFS